MSKKSHRLNKLKKLNIKKNKYLNIEKYTIDEVHALPISQIQDIFLIHVNNSVYVVGADFADGESQQVDKIQEHFYE